MSLVKISEDKLTKGENEVLVCEQVPVRKGYILAKRCLDFVGALCGLIFLFPVFFIVAVLIKYEDPNGPVFFKQIRVGKNGRDFYMYKFRSMVTDAEERLEDLLHQNEVSGAMFKMKDDPRVTKIGKFIRRTSIDELPQLINVLKGEMSLVGPRPPLPREVQEYTNYDRQRLMVKPGCTGIWQISGRSSLSFTEMVELDIEYIINRSLILDLKIIIKTVRVMLFDKNAY
ncbi:MULTISPECIES: sugar transferase [Bacillus cereus group]|uniref:Sugar transferase probable phospho-glucosyltransferase n=1 Tax=Bacillus thuringiensis subsp. konkukian (strain 97-27) TaxID=281309 RepID=Q6HB12_BACHK|nr:MULTISPECIES: sugar transferase [Bacillus cereus group]AAT61146.1 sugar transferase; probable phospho-glucosyltransferase [[Bacillus thuringiensis] serovar konkukian str. 97-27]AJI32727.1 exopolysaccharide biosynthesis polyprenyl glycosylphosphotransferase family protein [Bacillus thuringiensis]QKI27519.1 sugar transferase [Bacillus thuringiensis]